MNIEGLRMNERNALVTSGAFWTWVIGTQIPSGRDDLLFLPALLSVFFAAKALAYHRAIRSLSRYIRILESGLKLPEGMGWECHVLDKGPRIRFVRTVAFWGFVFAANLLAALVFDDQLPGALAM